MEDDATGRPELSEGGSPLGGDACFFSFVTVAILYLCM